MNRGIVLAVSAYIFWGLHPVYWRLLHKVPSLEIVSHRIVWSLLFFSIIISYRKEWKVLLRKIKESKDKWIFFVPAFLIGSNWTLYIWAVNAGFIIETSLGYFISPLVSVFLGVFFLKENLRRAQWFAVSIAGLGVFLMTVLYGQFPWISFLLAGSWGIYGLLRKKSPLNSVEGLTIETAVLSLLAILFFFNLAVKGNGSFLIEVSTSLLLVGCGVTSGLPLLIFIAGARMIPLSLIGILQYILPTILFFIGVYVYAEPLTNAKLIGFTFIWTALIIYSLEGIFSFKKKKQLLHPIDI